MKLKLLLIIPVLCFGQSEVNSTRRVQCGSCHDSGFVSTVSSGWVTCTDMYCGGYYDQEGFYHPPVDHNKCTRHFYCSRGHHFTREEL
jgi:hypothetical protein